MGGTLRCGRSADRRAGGWRLRSEELIATNSMLLHDCYFGNLGGTGKAHGTVVTLIKRQYGTFEAWEDEFRAMCLALGGAAGWAILNFCPRTAAVRTYWAADYRHSPVWGTPLLVMDMYEHAYDRDYGTDAHGYVDAFFQNVNWRAVNRRVEDAREGLRRGKREESRA